MMLSCPRLHISGLFVKLGKREVLHDLSLSFSQSLNYIVGRNGSGKTTLFRAILQLVPYQGRISTDQENLSALSSLALARQIALVPQRLSIPFPISVYDFVLMGRYPYMRAWGGYGKGDHQMVEEQLARLKIGHLAKQNLQHTSGGEFQKACIARALCQETPILLLDEPAQSLDPPNKAFLYQELAELSHQGKLIICNTHDLEALDNSEAVVWGIREGECVLQTNGGKIREDLFEFVY